MTSYNQSEMEESEKSGSEGTTHSSVADPALISKAKPEQLRDKVAQLSWKLQHTRAIKMAKRKGERSPCGWMEALNCNMPLSVCVYVCVRLVCYHHLHAIYYPARMRKG